MKLTMKLTERDKKLLIILVVVVLVAGLGGKVILPLMEKNNEMRTDLNAERMEQSQNLVKVTGLTGFRNSKEQMRETLNVSASEYTGIVGSQEIDRMLTETAVKGGVTVTGLTISMPEQENTALVNYEQTMKKGTESTQEESRTFAGFYTVQTMLRMSGSQEKLQAVLDTLMHREPAMRVMSFQWENAQREGISLSVSLEIYLFQSIEEYTQEQQEKQAEQADSPEQEAE